MKEVEETRKQRRKKQKKILRKKSTWNMRGRYERGGIKGRGKNLME